MSIRIVFVMPVAAVSMAFGFMAANAQQPQRAQPPQSLRLYVLDCGKITPANADAYGLKASEMATVNMITPCFLIVHPRGTMIWDTGEISDSAFKDGVSPQKLNTFTVDRPLLPQLAAIGYIPANITYLALPLPCRSCRQRPPVRRFNLDCAEGRPGPDPRPAARRTTGSRRRAGPEILRGPRQQQNDYAERRGS